MQLLPSELGICLLMAQSHPMYPFTPDESLVRGRQILVHLAGKDFGYDIVAWHEYLLNANLTGYRSRGAKRRSKRIAEMTADPAWIEIRRRVEETHLFEMTEERDRQKRTAIDNANLEWRNKDRECPNCQTRFRSIGDRGQCPQCRMIFYASRIDSNAQPPNVT